VAHHLLGIASDRKWIRYAHTHLIEMFPDLPQQSGWGKRVRQTTALLSAVITELARDTPSSGEISRLIDSTPVPCGKSRETVKRSDLAGHAGYGYCASHSRFFWGFRLYLICTPEGMPIVWGLANPKIGEREAAEAMLRHRGRTPDGVYVRVAGRLLALAAGIWHNWLIGAPNKRSLTAYDHEDSLI